MIERLLITSACAWYISYALTSTHGAFGMFERLREWREGRWHGRHGEATYAQWTDKDGITHETSRQYDPNGLLDCIVCLIFWIALGIGYLEGLTIIESIAAAGVGLFLHGYTGWRYQIQ